MTLRPVHLIRFLFSSLIDQQICRNIPNIQYVVHQTIINNMFSVEGSG